MKKRGLSIIGSWTISAVTFGILYSAFKFFYKISPDFTKIFTAEFYSGTVQQMFKVMRESFPDSSTNVKTLPVIITLYICFIFLVTIIYNIIDLLLIPYWMSKKGSEPDKRRQVRKKAIIYLVFAPFIIWIYILGNFISLFVGGNPATKGGRESIKDMAWEEAIKRSFNRQNHDVSSSNDVNSSSANSISDAMNRFQEEYTNAAAYAYQYGGPININNTYGLSQDQISMAISNAEAYLNSMGVDRRANMPPTIVNDTSGISQDDFRRAASNSDAYIDSLGYKR